jgi:hypothetical protein
MMIRRRPSSPLILAALILLGSAVAAGALELRQPSDPLRSTVALSFGVHELDNISYAEFFGESQLNAWNLRYDFRVLGPFRLGAGLSLTGKSKHNRDLSLGSDSYPVRYSFSAFQSMGELYLRSHLPQIGFLRPHASIGLLYSRIHAESTGYSNGYDAAWEDYRPAEEVVQLSSGWRAAFGLRLPIWANVTLFAEYGKIELDAYSEPTDTDPPVGEWDHSGNRYEIGFMQRF